MRSKRSVQANTFCRTGLSSFSAFMAAATQRTRFQTLSWEKTDTTLTSCLHSHRYQLERDPFGLSDEDAYPGCLLFAISFEPVTETTFSNRSSSKMRTAVIAVEAARLMSGPAATPPPEPEPEPESADEVCGACALSALSCAPSSRGGCPRLTTPPTPPPLLITLY